MGGGGEERQARLEKMTHRSDLRLVKITDTQIRFLLWGRISEGNQARAKGERFVPTGLGKGRFDASSVVTIGDKHFLI